MGLFSESECRHCESVDHASEDCPHNHGFFGIGASTACDHCGSKEHASADCPHDHGFFGFGASTKCDHCRSKEHASDDCPHDHGFLGIGASTKCEHCGSKVHASNDCPHDHGFLGIGASTECDHCGSKEHASDDCPHHSFMRFTAGDKRPNHGGEHPKIHSLSCHLPARRNSSGRSSASSYPIKTSHHENSNAVFSEHPETGNLLIGVVILGLVSALVGAFLSFEPHFRHSSNQPSSVYAAPPTTQIPSSQPWIQPEETQSRLLEQAHAEIDRVYKAKMAMLNPAQQEILRKEERKWIKWRDAEAERIAQMTSTDGRADFVDYLEAMIHLVKQRTEYLRLY